MFEIISGFQKPEYGQVKIFGKDITKTPPAHITQKHGGVRTFQTSRLFDSLSVWENLMVAGTKPQDEHALSSLLPTKQTYRDERRVSDRVYALLSTLALPEQKNTRTEALSGGQCKLVSLGTALMTSAPLLLLDEPTVGVHQSVVQSILDLIRSLNQQGFTFVIIEHNINMILQLCDHVIVLDRGAVVAEGTPESIHPFLQETHSFA